jgi:glycine C-acetyltransferase
VFDMTATAHRSRPFDAFVHEELADMRRAGALRDDLVVSGPQGPVVTVDGRELVNLISNDYLGLASDPRVIATALAAIPRDGLGVAGGRALCGSRDAHDQLEAEVAALVGKPDALLYGSCLDANGGLFGPLFTRDDVIFSDELNHASIIDGLRLCSARCSVFRHADMDHLEELLRASADARHRGIVTDGMFSMDGDLARLDQICELADRYDAVVIVDDAHATGVFGPTGGGSAEHFALTERVDVVTGTLGKALGGIMGGFTAASAEVVALLRARSRAYIFTNAIPPALATAAATAVRLSRDGDALRARLFQSATTMRRALGELGLDVLPGPGPIIPVILGENDVARDVARRLRAHGVLALAMTHPIVPPGTARIRVQVSAAHTDEQLGRAVDSFAAALEEVR